MSFVSLGSILASLESGARPPGGVSADSGEIPSLGGEHLTEDGGFDFTSIKRIPRAFFETMKGGRIAARDILVVKDGATTGKTSFVGGDFPFPEAAINEHVFCLRVDQSKASPEYVFHFLRSPIGQRAIALDFRGATVGGISRGFAKKVRLPLPSLPEQRRIAGILDKADALRAKRRAALAQLDILIQSIFLDMFGDPATNPKGWPNTELKDCIERIQIGPFGSLLHREDYITGGVPLVNPKHIQSGAIVVGDGESITTQKYTQLNAYHLRAGDVVMGRRGEMGRCAIVDAASCPLLCGTGSLFIRPDNIRTSSLFLWATLSSASIKSKLERLSLGQTLPNLNTQIVEHLQVPLAPIELQRDFVRRVAAVNLLRTKQQTSCRQLQYLFTSLQYRAFQGEL